MEESQNKRAVRWYRRPGVALGGLLLVYPVGLVLLGLSLKPRRRWKIPLALLFAPVFVAHLHFVFGLRVDFLGDVSPRLEFFNEAWHAHRLAVNRQAQQGRTRDVLPALEVTADDWPGFRGRERDGVVRAGGFVLPWPEEGPRLLWDQPIGGGYSSFAIAGGRAYTIEQRGKEEVITCYGLATGRELWSRGYAARFKGRTSGDGPRSTPTVADGRVYAVGATGILKCLEGATGDVIWERHILDDASAPNLEWGMAASPWVHDEKVYVVPGGKEASVIAYDAASGDEVWRSGGSKAGYASPMVATLHGSLQLLVFDGEGLSAYDPADGRAWWRFDWETDYDINVGQPVVLDEERVMISSGYGHGAALLRITKTEEGFGVEEVWSNKHLRLKFSSAVLRDGFVYGLNENILACLKADTGERQWRGGRYGYGQVILAGEYLIVQCEDGDLALVEATPEAFREVSRIEALGSKTWNQPAFGRGKLLIRSTRRMMCFDLAGETPE